MSRNMQTLITWIYWKLAGSGVLSGKRLRVSVEAFVSKMSSTYFVKKIRDLSCKRSI